MATTAQTTKPAPVAKTKRDPISLTARITQQLDRAVLGRKVTKEELAALAAHIGKLDAFLSA